MAKELSRWQPTCSPPPPPPPPPPSSFQRKLESRRAGRGVRRIARVTLAGITHGCHSRLAGMYEINHWIPAFAGRLRASSAACTDAALPPVSMQACPLAAYRTSSAARSRRRSTTYILVGVSINDGGLGSGIGQAWQRSCRDGNPPVPPLVVIPAKARLHGCTPTGMYACMDASSRAVSGTSGRGSSSSPPLEGRPPGWGGK